VDTATSHEDMLVGQQIELFRWCLSPTSHDRTARWRVPRRHVVLGWWHCSLVLGWNVGWNTLHLRHNITDVFFTSSIFCWTFICQLLRRPSCPMRIWLSDWNYPFWISPGTNDHKHCCHESNNNAERWQKIRNAFIFRRSNNNCDLTYDQSAAHCFSVIICHDFLMTGILATLGAICTTIRLRRYCCHLNCNAGWPLTSWKSGERFEITRHNFFLDRRLELTSNNGISSNLDWYLRPLAFTRTDKSFLAD